MGTIAEHPGLSTLAGSPKEVHAQPGTSGAGRPALLPRCVANIFEGTEFPRMNPRADGGQTR